MSGDVARLVAMLVSPEEIANVFRLLAAMEEVGWASPQEAAVWRGRIAAVRIFHEDPHLWIDGPEAWRSRRDVECPMQGGRRAWRTPSIRSKS